MKNTIIVLCKILWISKKDIHNIKSLPSTDDKDAVSYLSFKWSYNGYYLNARIYENWNFFLYKKKKISDWEYETEYIDSVDEAKVMLNSRTKSTVMNIADFKSTKVDLKDIDL